MIIYLFLFPLICGQSVRGVLPQQQQSGQSVRDALPQLNNTYKIADIVRISGMTVQTTK